MSGYTDEAIRHGVLDANVEFIQKPFYFDRTVANAAVSSYGPRRGNVELLVINDFCMVNHHPLLAGNHRTEESLVRHETAIPAYRSVPLDHAGWRVAYLCYEASTLTNFRGEDQRSQKVIQTEMRQASRVRMALAKLSRDRLWVQQISLIPNGRTEWTTKRFSSLTAVD
jgi:hypothetical protein